MVTPLTDNTPVGPAELADLPALVDPAVEQATTWIRRAQQLSEEGVADSDAADRLSAILQDPRGLDFTVGFVDRVIRTEDSVAAARALQRIASIAPKSLSALDRSQILSGSYMSHLAPDRKSVV